MRIKHGDHHHDLPDDDDPIFDGDAIGIPMSDDFEQARHATGKATAAMMIKVMLDTKMRDPKPEDIMALVAAVGSLGFLVGALWRDNFPDSDIPIKEIVEDAKARAEAPPERDPWSNEQEFRKFLKNLQGMN